MNDHSQPLNDTAFEAALIDAAFAQGGELGWARVSPAVAAKRAGLDLVRARTLFPSTGSILKKFGRRADEAALSYLALEGTAKDRLFDIIMSRFDYLQLHRDGVIALIRFLPLCPPMAVALAEMNITSMGWLLAGAGVDATGFSGGLKKRGLLAVWLYAMRAWSSDESPDLTATMSAVDSALAKVEGLMARFGSKPVNEPGPVSEDVESISVSE